MISREAQEKLLFGLKVRQVRTRQGLSFAELSALSGLAVSYLNEIEKGKKYPREEKMQALAKALQMPVEELASTEELDGRLGPVGELLRSNFLQDLPLAFFGIEPAKVVELISAAPREVGAFVSILLDLSRNYPLREENFYFGALRAYLELHHNYFEEIEAAADRFRQEHGALPEGAEPAARFLENILKERFGYQIVPEGLNAYPELGNLRSVFLPKNSRLLMQGGLPVVQRAFQYGKELGFQYLDLSQRANTSSLLRVHSFEEAINHFKAGYFSAALLIERGAFAQDMERFLAQDRWNESWANELFAKYAASPETILQRMSNLLPARFGIRKFFLWRLARRGDDIRPDKELNLVREHLPTRNTLMEHFCRRWPAARMLDAPAGSIHASRVTIHDTGDAFLCFSVAGPSADGGRQSSVTLGLLVEKNLKEKIGFLEDPALGAHVANLTCERCNLEGCAERRAAPVIFLAREKNRRVKEVLKTLENL
jgi:XRE family transcriptional regulator, fatty acid utilization regulator